MSKTIVFICRVVVVLAFVTIIPLIALFGDSLPEVAETVWGFWKKPVEENHWADAEEAPPFTPTTSSTGPANYCATSPQPGANTTSPLSTNLQLSVPNASPQQGQNLAVVAPGDSNRSTIPASFNTSVPLPATSSSQPLYGNPANPGARPMGSIAETAPRYGSPVVSLENAPTHNSEAVPYGNPATPSSAIANNVGMPSRFPNMPAAGIPQVERQQTPQQTAMAPAPASQQNSAFEQISQRLKQLGATYYRLEAWGNGTPLFRFQCRMSVIGSAGLTRQFEATHQDPVEAMRQVLRKIETWQQSQPSAKPLAPSPMVTDVRNAPNAQR